MSQMNNKQASAGKKALGFLASNSVPVMFIVICAICIPISGFSPAYLLNEIVTRMGRNIFLILSLLIPIMAGMGLNFGMTLGAMAGEIALIFVTDWQIWGIPGVVLAMIVSIPLLGASSPKVSTTLRPSQPNRALSVSGVIRSRSGTPCGIIAIWRGSAP